MPTIPPKPDNAPEAGSIWYCKILGGWPNPWQRYAKLGSIAKVVEVFYSNNVWKVRMNTTINPEYGFVNVTCTIPVFYSAFGTQKFLTLAALISPGGEGRPKLLMSKLSATGRVFVTAGFSHKLHGLRAVKGKGFVSTVQNRPTLIRY